MARSKGKAKRKLKRMVNPFYGKKGMGWINNPKAAASGKLKRSGKKAANGLIGCLGICIWYPIYFTFLLAWWIIKYTFLCVWWIIVFIINAVISIFEWLININSSDEV